MCTLVPPLSHQQSHSDGAQFVISSAPTGGGRWEPYVLFLPVAFYLCPKARTLGHTSGLRSSLERDPFKVR